MRQQGPATELEQGLGLMGLVATGVCSMIGAAIHIIPVMIQRNVPGIGPHVMLAYLVAIVPVILAASAYAILGSGMPRAGGSYVYASRALHPYLGFVASFSQWFGLCVAMGVVAYVLVPFLRDLLQPLGVDPAGLEAAPWRLTIALACIWVFALVNVLGIRVYERTLVTLMWLMFGGIIVVIPIGFAYEHADFVRALQAREGVVMAARQAAPLSLEQLLAASAILFASFIGFDSIAQAGGEARNPSRSLPLATAIAVITVGVFYMLFAAAIYHAVPWSFIAERALESDLTAPGLLGYLLPPAWTVLIVIGATLGIINNFPAMILAVSRLLFAWSEDGVFPKTFAAVNSRWHTPVRAILLSCGLSSLGVVGCHLAGDFFLGVDVLVTAMLINFILICLSVVTLEHRNPELASRLRVGRSRPVRILVGGGGALALIVYLAAHTAKDLGSSTAWYLRSTWLWVLVTAAGSVVFLLNWNRLKGEGLDMKARFARLPHR